MGARVTRAGRRALAVLTPRLWSQVHLVLTAAWILAIPPTLLWWRNSVLWVALMSLWANIASHFAAWQASRAEMRLDPDDPL